MRNIAIINENALVTRFDSLEIVLCVPILAPKTSLKYYRLNFKGLLWVRRLNTCLGFDTLAMIAV